MAKRGPSGDGMVLKRTDGQWYLRFMSGVT